MGAGIKLEWLLVGQLLHLMYLESIVGLHIVKVLFEQVLSLSDRYRQACTVTKLLIRLLTCLAIHANFRAFAASILLQCNNASVMVSCCSWVVGITLHWSRALWCRHQLPQQQQHTFSSIGSHSARLRLRRPHCVMPPFRRSLMKSRPVLALYSVALQSCGINP